MKTTLWTFGEWAKKENKGKMMFVFIYFELEASGIIAH